MKCVCCHSEFIVTDDGLICDYCGFENFGTLNEAGKERELQRAERHRKSILGKLSGFSLKADSFIWNTETNNYKKTGSVDLFASDLNKVQCGQSIIRSNKWIAHFDGETLLNVKYVFAGKEKTIPVTISPKPSEGCWYPFIHINDDLQLEIGLIVVPVGEANKSRKELLATVDLDFTV